VAEAEAAARAGGRRSSPTELELPARETFQQQYEAALQLVAAAQDVTLDRLEGSVLNVSRLFLDPWE
jgi:hypothetical protein